MRAERVSEPRRPASSAAASARLCAALHNLGSGKPLPEGETLARLAGYAAFIHQSDPELGKKLLAKLGELEQEQG